MDLRNVITYDDIKNKDGKEILHIINNLIENVNNTIKNNMTNCRSFFEEETFMVFCISVESLNILSIALILNIDNAYSEGEESNPSNTYNSHLINSITTLTDSISSSHEFYYNFDFDYDKSSILLNNMVTTAKVKSIYLENYFNRVMRNFKTLSLCILDKTKPLTFSQTNGILNTLYTAFGSIVKLHILLIELLLSND